MLEIIDVDKFYNSEYSKYMEGMNMRTREELELEVATFTGLEDHDEQARLRLEGALSELATLEDR